MARNKSNNHLYIGRAGHLSAMSECLSRGWNVAIPEVDVGEDIFVVEDATSRLAKVQVKTATGKQNKNGFKAQFELSLRQLEDTSEKGNDLRYIFTTRYRKKWQPFIILKREDLLNKHRLEYTGSLTKTGNLILNLYFKTNNEGQIYEVLSGTKRGFSKSDFTSYIENWAIFFSLKILEGNE